MIMDLVSAPLSKLLGLEDVREKVIVTEDLYIIKSTFFPI